jgi:hypothetical protein
VSGWTDEGDAPADEAARAQAAHEVLVWSDYI